MMENKKLTISMAILLFFMMILMAVPAYAWTDDIGSQPLVRRNIDNYNNNWPYEIRRQCVVEQSRVVLECSKSGFKNWIVFQTVAGKGKYKDKDVSMFYKGYISGNYECSPPETRAVDGFLVDDIFHINSGLVDRQVKSLGKNNTVQYSRFTCDFLCQAWDCGEKSLEEKIAEQRIDLKKEKIFCVRNIFSEGITPQEREFLEAKWVSDEEREELERRQKEANDKITKWWSNWYNLLEKLCKSKGENCKFFQVYNKETRLKEVVEQDYYWIEDDDEVYTGEKLVEYCWYCSCWNISQFPKTTLREGDLKRAERLLEKYGKKDTILSKIDSLGQETYTTPSYLKGKKVNFVVYDGNDELATIGINFGEEIEIGEGSFRDANIICEAQFEEISEIKTLNELVGLAENKCRGADFLTDVVLNINKFLKGVVELFS